jgi:hypothetical protein
MADEAPETPAEVPDGAAVFPEIPEELTVHPLLLAVLHGCVFIGGSAETIVQPDAGIEALESMAGYLVRLQGDELRRVKDDMKALAAYAKQQGWPKSLTLFLKTFLQDFGVGADRDS